MGDRLNLRRITVAIALALGVTVALAPQAQAARGTAPDGTYVTCSENPALAYLMVAGAPIYVWDFNNTGAPPQGQPMSIQCSDDGSTPADQTSPWYPTANGTFVQGWSGGTAVGSVYEIVGGAPLTVAAPAGATIEKFDDKSLPPAAGPDQSTVGGTPVYGMFSSVVRNGYFVTGSGTYYRTDSSGHLVVRSGAIAGQTAPVVDQNSVNTCERMNCDPWGDMAATVVGNGKIRITGWALDVVPEAVTVHVEAAGRVFDVPANQPRADLNKSLGVAGNHGFDRVLSVPAGHYSLCTTFLGFAPGATSANEGCQVVDVPGTKPGRVHRPKIKAKGHGVALIKWKAPNAHGSPISTYVVHTNVGKKKQIAGTTTHLKLKHLAGKRLTVKVKAQNEAGAGKYSKKSKMVRIR